MRNDEYRIHHSSFITHHSSFALRPLIRSARHQARAGRAVLIHSGPNEVKDEIRFVVDLQPGAALGDDEKSLIARYSGTTGAEMMSWCIEDAGKWPRSRPERLKALVVVHDGQPVYVDSTRHVSDRDLSKQAIRQLETDAVMIGMCLEPDVVGAMREFFSRLVVSTAEELPEKLGAILEAMY